MEDADKLMKLYEIVHGVPSRSCRLELALDEDEYTPIGVNLMKDGNLCAFHSKEDLTFDYVTRGW